MQVQLHTTDSGDEPQGFIESTCFSSLFSMKLDKSFLQGKFFGVDIIDPSGATFPLSEELAARCGYVLSEDIWGNPIFRASVLGCHVTNELDERFSLNVDIRVSSFQDMRAPTTYRNAMRCSYFPWAPREIVCEENYMEVSVKSDVPVISDKETAEWMSALPETQKVVYDIWQLIFSSPSGRKTTLVSNADKLGYGFNNTLARVFLHSPYSTNETDVSLSTVSNEVYGTIYSIHLFLEHTWTDTDWHLTKYTVIKPITTPFMPQIPTVVNRTVPDSRRFDVAFGVFLPDVTLVALTIGGKPLSPGETEHKVYKIYESPFPNGTKSFHLEVPFDDPNVLKEYVNRNETTYILLVNYTLNVGPDMIPYHHPAKIECTIADIELPEGVGYCDRENMYLAISVSGLYQHWSLYVGNNLLNHATALSNGYRITTNNTHLVLQVPLFAVGIIYEAVSLERIQARFDLALKKTKTMQTLDIFSVRCSYHSSEFIVCYPNGTIAVSAFMKTVPSIDMGKTRLRDIACKPEEFTQEQAFFQFHVSTCGTSLRFEGEHLIYENEISFEKETFSAQGPPMITRDPGYRLTILCYYPTKETLMQSALVQASSSSNSYPPFGYGTMMARSNTADKSFTERYEPHSTVVKYIWEPVFLEAELKNEDPDLRLYLENCWMSESKEFTSMPQWNLIVDGQVAVVTIVTV
uniref:Uncharacterized protein n=1 Tax=Sphaerodactylus townsendi TaxID=933632 RepID=A0ACB8GDV9_9SAUR